MPDRRVLVCAGIGDSIWLIQKLINSGERFVFEVANGEPRRGHQIFEILPQLASYVCYGDSSSQMVIESNIQDVKPLWKSVTEQGFCLSANKHLEAGKRLEGFFPDLKTSFTVDWDTKKYAEEAKSYVPSGEDVVGLYGSSYSTIRSWGFWNAARWLDLALQIRQRTPKAVFVLIGADFDQDLVTDLSCLMQGRMMPHRTLVGKPLGLVVEVMKRLRYFYSFPSGLGILAPTVLCPTMMFYPPHLHPMMNAWADPAMIERQEYIGVPFIDPGAAFERTPERFKVNV